MGAVIEIPADNLPEDTGARELLLARYFQRQYVQTERTVNGWRVQTAWSQNGAYYIDPNLSIGLANWPATVPVGAIPLTVKQEQGFLLALNDCWSLLSWSCKLGEWKSKNKLPDKINVIHLDSHTDLNSPRISYDDGDWLDLLTNKPISVFDPRSVAAGIQSGAVGIGSFIAPLIASEVPIDFFHLAPKRHLRYSPGCYGMKLDLRTVDPLFPKAERPHIQIDHQNSASRYFTSDTVDDLLPQIDRRHPVLLHIDMDYFNNRFDGRPDWSAVDDRHDPDGQQILLKIDQFFQQWLDGGIAVADVTVGISPGFFPANSGNKASTEFEFGFNR